jgi:hypothetical protein
MDAWNRNLLRGGATGLALYAISYPASVWLGPKIAPSCAKLGHRERLEWASYVPSTINASLIAFAISRQVLNVSVRGRQPLLPTGLSVRGNRVVSTDPRAVCCPSSCVPAAFLRTSRVLSSGSPSLSVIFPLI